MGGLISSAFLIDYQGMVSGAVLSGSLVMVPDYITDLTISLGQVISSVMPKMRLVGIDSEGLSRDPSIVRAYQEDPLVYNGKATARISAEINKGIAQIAERGTAITCPVLILHGGADRVVNPRSSRYLFDLVSSTDKEIIIYEGYFHEVYNEPGKEKVFQDVLSWLNKHIP
jgi:alpha-beta hydrolase superfamily lysophospholipase